MNIYTNNNFLSGQLTIKSDSSNNLISGKFVVYDSFSDQILKFKAKAKCKCHSNFDEQTGINIVKLKLAKNYYSYKKNQARLLKEQYTKKLNEANLLYNFANKKLNNIKSSLSKYDLTFY